MSEIHFLTLLHQLEVMLRNRIVIKFKRFFLLPIRDHNRTYYHLLLILNITSYCCLADQSHTLNETPFSEFKVLLCIVSTSVKEVGLILRRVAYGLKSYIQSSNRGIVMVFKAPSKRKLINMRRNHLTWRNRTRSTLENKAKKPVV